MKFAVPTANGKLCAHFGHCENFSLIEVDSETRKIIKNTLVEPPPHEPGLLPRWLAERNVTTIIAGGMGQRAQNLFKEKTIAVVTGAHPDTPENLVESYLAGTMKTGANTCDH